MFAAILNACIYLLNQSGIAQREAPFAALSIVPAITDCESVVEVVANPKGHILWMKTRGAVDASVIMEPNFEKLIKQQAKSVISMTFNN